MTIKSFIKAFGRSVGSSFSAFDIPLFDWLPLFTLFIVLDDKGGVGKSFIAQVIAAIIRYFEVYKVRMVDTDFSNSISAQIFKTTKMLNLDERVHIGVLMNIIKELMSGVFQHAVIDAGARDEGKVRKLLPWLAQLVRNAGGRIVVIRPITLSSHNQRNAASFMNLAAELGVPVVFVCNESQGRQPEYFDGWKATQTCASALEKGAVQISITDADVRYADEAVGFGLSMWDVAAGDFSKLEFSEELHPDADEDARREFDERRANAEADLAAAHEFFNDDVVAFINEWLRLNIATIGAAIQDAINKRASLDAEDAAPDDEPGQEPKAAKRKRR